MKMNLIKKLSVLVFAACVGTAAFAQRAPVYISPNNDGVKDELTVPLKIKEKRYISAWSFIISDSDGNVVRIIGNKEKREEKITFKNFWKRLFTPKTGVTIPSSVTWNGYFDDGTLAPDGVYYYQFSATDDNDNTATTSKLKVIVDNTAPDVNVTPVADNDKTFGEGSKSVLKITQEGSKENLWTAKIFDATTKKTVRTFKWENSEPEDFEWDGEDQDGNQVPDGVYTYEISAVDAAGNRSPTAFLTNIIFSAEKPTISIAIDGSKYFSPNGDGEKDTVKLLISIPAPTSKTNKLTSWKVEILGKDKKVVRTYSGSDKAPTFITFDGLKDDGTLVTKTSDRFTARVSAKYLNGYEPAPMISPEFVLDNVFPSATVFVKSKVFNAKGSLEINQSVVNAEESWTGAKNWIGRIISTDGIIVKKYDFGETIPNTIFWNGIDDAGAAAKDATYYYELTGTEPAGNTGVYKSDTFVLDTSKTELMLSALPEAFSPRLGKTVSFTPVAKSSSGISSYTLKVYDEGKNEVKSFSGTGNLPKSISWDGNDNSNTRCADGKYYAVLETVAKNGDSASTQSQNIIIDSVAPTVEIAVPYTIFSPDGVSSRQDVPVTVTSSVENKWVAEIRRSGDSVNVPAVRTFTWNNSSAQNFSWNGTDEAGNKCPNGLYQISVSSTDAAGNSAAAVIKNINLDMREAKAYITPELTGISPNGDGIKEVQRFTVKTTLAEGITAWNFKVLDEKNGVVKEWSNKDSGADLPALFVWNGAVADGTAAEGTFHSTLHLEYEKGNTVEAESSSFICSATPPLLAVQTRTADSGIYFSPDNDGVDDELYIRLRRTNNLVDLSNWSFTIYDRKDNEFWKTSGKSTITERIIWDGRGNNGELVQSAEDYTYIFRAEDELGMKSEVQGIISVDVLVIRDGNKLKMQVPSIIFRSDNADFLTVGELDSKGKKVTSGITLEQKSNNEAILRRISVILDKFKDYNVTVVGHANRLTDNPDEETMDNPNNWGPALIPLSLARASYVRNILVEYGVSESRLNVEGKGGTEPIADTKDKNVNWKNRRVEFILEK